MAKKGSSEGTVILSRLILIGVLALLAPFFLASFIFLFFALIPTILAYLADKSKVRYKWLCVGSLNVAGAIPYLFSLWFGDNTYKDAIAIITNIYNIMIMYGAAGAGCLIYLLVPPAVASYIQMSNQRRLVSLKETLEGLVEKWGENVVTTSEEDLKAKK